MGWGPSPSIAQLAHECLLYGTAGDGGPRAQELTPLLEPEGRWSSLRVPPTGSRATTHSLVIDDLLLFRTVTQPPANDTTSPGVPPRPVPSDDLIDAIRQRYTAVGLECREAKVHPFASTAEALGYALHDNTWSCTLLRYAELIATVNALVRRGWTRPREVDSLVGRFTNVFLLHRMSLFIFSSAYVFIQRAGDRPARLWPSVAHELLVAADILPLVQADVSRPCAPLLLQTDASPSGSGMVYSSCIPGGVSAVENECRRPRPLLRRVPEEDPRSPQRCERSSTCRSSLARGASAFASATGRRSVGTSTSSSSRPSLTPRGGCPDRTRGHVVGSCSSSTRWLSHVLSARAGAPGLRFPSISAVSLP